MLNDNKRLKNKGHWRSTGKWNFRPKDDSNLIYIENTSQQGKVWEAQSNGSVTFKNFEEGKAEQLWKKGVPDAEFDGAEI